MQLIIYETVIELKNVENTQKFVELGYIEFGTKPRIKICEHIEILGKETGKGIGEYQRELSVYCKECNKIYQLQLEIE